MVPIYAVEAYFGLIIRQSSEIFEVMRQCYEVKDRICLLLRRNAPYLSQAFTLLSFMQLMLSYLAVSTSTTTVVEDNKTAIFQVGGMLSLHSATHIHLRRSLWI